MNRREATLEAGEVDLVVARNIRKWRLAAAMSQRTPADAIGVSVQIFSRIEKGKLRIQAGRLLALSHLFGCSIDDFFEGAGGNAVVQPADPSKGHLIVRHFKQIADHSTRAALATMAKALADASLAARGARSGPASE